MRRIARIRLKNQSKKFLKIFGIIFFVALTVFLIYSHELHTIIKLGYSRQSSNYVLFHNLKSYVVNVGENKTLDAAFSSVDFRDEYIDKYQDINYYNYNNFIKIINTFLDKKYSTNNINMILEHGNYEDVVAFSKRDKVRYLEEFFSISYAKLKYYDRYVAYSDETGEDDENTVLIVNMDLDKEDYVEYKKVESFNTNMLVNKHRMLDENFVPDNLVNLEQPYASNNEMKANKEAYDAFKNMFESAKNEGYGIVINSAYRSYKMQEELCNFYRGSYGSDYVDKYVAKPGFSEHQTGLGFDVGSTSSNVFARSKEYSWMQENAHKYGFILRFPEKYISITGFNSEPWHYRYVGVKIATYIHDNNMPYEKYYAMFLDD